jgi:hypothetical protein
MPAYRAVKQVSRNQGLKLWRTGRDEDANWKLIVARSVIRGIVRPSCKKE